MIVDLLTVTREHIEASTKKSIENDNTVVVYLENNGDAKHFWDNEKLMGFLDEDIDE